MRKMYSMMMLAVAMIIMSSTAKAQTTETYDFTADPLVDATFTLSETSDYTQAYSETALYLGTDESLNGRFAFCANNGDYVWSAPSGRGLRRGKGAYVKSKGEQQYFSLLGLCNGDQIVFTVNNTSSQFYVQSDNLQAEDGSSLIAGDQITFTSEDGKSTTLTVSTDEASAQIDFLMVASESSKNTMGISKIEIITAGGDGTTGINQVNLSDTSVENNVYSLDGRLVKQDASSLSGLAKGVYIKNGKKIVVNK